MERHRKARRVFLILALCGAAAGAFAQAPKGYLGVHAKSNSNVLDAKNALTGVTVTSVAENSPAEAAGLKVNDIILRANGQEMADPNQLYGLAESLEIGATIELSVERDKEMKELKARTVARVPPPDAPAEDAPKTFVENRRLGLEFRTPSAEKAARLKLAPRDGVEIIRVAPRGPMAEAKIAAGSAIVEADGEPVHSPDAFLERVKGSQAKSIKLALVDDKGARRGAKVHFYRPPEKVSKFNIIPLFTYKRDQNATKFSFLLGFFARERLAGATKYTFLWFIPFETGSSEELLEVEPVQ